MKNARWISLLVAAVILAFLGFQLTTVWKHLDERSSDSAASVEVVVKRDLGAAFFEEERFEESRAALQWVTEQSSASAQDFVNLACVEMAAVDGDAIRARTALDEAERRDSELPSLWYCRGVLAKRDIDFEQAATFFEKTRGLAPDDLPTLFHHAQAVEELGDREAAIEAFEGIVDRGVEFGGSYYFMSVYRLFQVLRRSGAPEERWGFYKARHKELSDAGMEAASLKDMEMGVLGRVQVPAPAPNMGQLASGAALPFELIDEVAHDAGAIQDLFAADLNGDRRQDFAFVGANGLFLALQQEGAKFEVQKVRDGQWQRVAAADLNNGGRRSLLLWGGGATTLLAPKPNLEFVDNPLPNAPAIRDARFVDYDHEGDLDLLFSDDAGLHLWRNDGGEPVEEGSEAPALVSFADVTESASFPDGNFDWVTFDDFDADSDVDFLVGGASSPTVVVSNLRKGRFEAIAADKSGFPDSLPVAPLLADLNHDGFVDVCAAGATPWLGMNRGDGSMESQPVGSGLSAAMNETAALADFDLDGQRDIAVVQESGVQLCRGSLLRGGKALEPAVAMEAMVPVAVSDADQDGDTDLVVADSSALKIWRNGAAANGSVLRVVLQGRKDNRQGVGPIVEVRSGELYQRTYSRGDVLNFGLGNALESDVVRVSWPNGVVQYVVHPPLQEDLVVLQKEGLVGSCPFLYTFNGEEYEFISDILGITPLGLPMVEGQYVPPDHDELIRVTGDQLKPVDGEYRMAVTEELREVTYLDRAELWVVDHPAEVEVHPEERFCFPPFPPQTLHAMRGALPVTGAVDQDGVDWTEALQETDTVHAVPFKALPSQFLGLVTPHHLDLTLPETARDAARIRLVMTGWFYWTDASVNVAAGHHKSYEFVPPLMQVPDSQGGWRDTGPPLGFPAGKTKTMVVDVTDRVNREDLRVRLFSTIRLYWDSIRIAVDEGEESLQITKLEPTRADLQYRGFSRPIPVHREDLPEVFDFEVLTEHPRWNQHRGMLTGYGDVLPLLGAVDDQFAIFSAGDWIDLRFDATQVPELGEGMARTYLLFTDGWAKDGDPNTEYANLVEPLPFHGMSGYPYGKDEGYPDTAETREYRREWNTRAGVRLIPEMVELDGDA